MNSNKNNIWITKGSGEKAEFSEKKLRFSLEKSGAKNEDVERILLEIRKILYPGMTTKEIYKKAFALLKKTARPLAAKYKLRNALMELGPSGFPFERYIAEILKHQGYKTQVGQIVKGHCVKHEVDVIADKNNERVLVECKYHSENSRTSNIKVALYIHARYLDIEKEWNKKTEHDLELKPIWIVTNTNFSSDSMLYATCNNMYLLSWNYPKGSSLRERIDETGLHPITCLTTLTGREKKSLLEKNIVLSKTICENEKALFDINIPEPRASKIRAEAHGLCINKNHLTTT